jgi:outer membrane protein assembly factor BamB
VRSFRARLPPWRLLSPTGLVLGLTVSLLVIGATFLFLVRPSTFSGFNQEKGPVLTPTVLWAFEPAERGAIVSTPFVTEDRAYVGAIHDIGLSAVGMVLCLSRQTGKEIWRFTDDGEMLNMASSPCVAEGRLYIGEGMHASHDCKFYCLDATTGHKLWQVNTQGHIESSPCVASERVYFGSGDDGIYCQDAVTGKRCWQYRGAFHVDSNPAVVGNRLYAGSGISRLHKNTAAFCLDTADGRVVWREPTDLPVWGSPTIDGDDVYFGLGNGRLTNSVAPPETPAGALLCLDCRTGQSRWRYPVADGVLAQPSVDAQRVYFTSRDGHCYAVERKSGQLAWKQDLGSPVVTRPAVVDGRVYVVATGGRIGCFAAESGAPLWTWDLAAYTRMQPRLFSSPTVLPEGPTSQSRRGIYFGTELRNPVSSAAVVYCLRDPPEPP